MQRDAHTITITAVFCLDLHCPQWFTVALNWTFKFWLSFYPFAIHTASRIFSSTERQHAHTHRRTQLDVFLAGNFFAIFDYVYREKYWPGRQRSEMVTWWKGTHTAWSVSGSKTFDCLFGCSGKSNVRNFFWCQHYLCSRSCSDLKARFRNTVDWRCLPWTAQDPYHAQTLNTTTRWRQG